MTDDLLGPLTVLLSLEVSSRAMCCTRAAGSAAGSDGSVDVKMLAEQNLQLKEALKRLHTHSIGEKTEVCRANPVHDQSCVQVYKKVCKSATGGRFKEPAQVFVCGDNDEAFPSWQVLVKPLVFHHIRTRGLRDVLSASVSRTAHFGVFS